MTPQLYLHIAGNVYAVQVLPGFPRGNVRRVVRLTKRVDLFSKPDAGDEIYDVAAFASGLSECSCPHWIFRCSKEPDQRVAAARCKHILSVAYPEVGLISLPEPVDVKPVAAPAKVEVVDEPVPF